MNSTLLCTPATGLRAAAGLGMPASPVAPMPSVMTSSVALPAATAAPAALVIAVEVPGSQETSVRDRAVAVLAQVGAQFPARTDAPARTQGPPSRGTPV